MKKYNGKNKISGVVSDFKYCDELYLFAYLFQVCLYEDFNPNKTKQEQRI